MDGASLDLRRDIAVDRLAALEAIHSPQSASLEVSGAFRVVGTRPAILRVQSVPERIVEPLPAGRGDVQRLAGRQLQARRHEMQLDAPACRMLVPHPQHVVLVGFEPGERRLLEFVHHLLLLRLAGGVFERERDHARGVAPFPVEAVDQLAGPLGVTAQDLRDGSLAALPTRHVVDRPAAAALTASEELNQHRQFPARCLPSAPPAPDRSRSAGRSPPALRPSSGHGSPSGQAG